MSAEEGHWHAVVVVETSVALPPDLGRPLLFELALDPDVHAAGQSRHRERVSSRTGAGHLRLGDEVTFEARHLGMQWSMTARVTALDRPVRFVDEQVRGPFAAFRHEHLFEAAGDRTLMRDVFGFRLPGRWLGRIAAGAVAAPYLRRLLRKRGEHLRRLAESSGRAA